MFIKVRCKTCNKIMIIENSKQFKKIIKNSFMCDECIVEQYKKFYKK